MKPIATLIAALAVSAFASGSPVTPASTPQPRPNFLIIVADDLGYEKLSCYGGINVATPHLDAMAARGLRFTRAYASAVCTPSRMSLYTGTYATRHGHDNVLPIHLGSREAIDFNDRFSTYAQLLRAAGYATSVTGKWQLGALEFHPDHCRTAGFDSWCVWQIWRDGKKTVRYWNPVLNRDGEIIPGLEERFGPDVLTNYVIDRIRSAVEDEQPFCIHHNMMLPHLPIVETTEDRRLGLHASLDRMITYLDAQVGRLVAELEDLDILDDTYVFFLGDNGTDVKQPRQTTAGTVRGGKHQLNDAGMHIPLIALGPSRVRAGQTADDLVDITDFFATLCKLAAAEIPKGAAPDSISFEPILTGSGPSERAWVTASLRNDACVFDGQWRLHARDGALIDCRSLPLEKPADDSAAAAAARKHLQPVLDRLLALEP